LKNIKTLEKREFEKKIFVGVKSLSKKDEEIYIFRIKKIIVENNKIMIEGKKAMENKKNSQIELDKQIGILRKNIDLMEDAHRYADSSNSLIEDYYKKLYILINIKKEVEFG